MTAIAAAGVSAQNQVNLPFCGGATNCQGAPAAVKKAAPPCTTCPNPMTVVKSENLGCDNIVFKWERPVSCKRVAQYQIRIKDNKGVYQELNRSIGNQFNLRVSHWALRAWPFNLKHDAQVVSSMRSWSPNGWSKWSADSTETANLQQCAAVQKAAPSRKGCCDPCDASSDDEDAPVAQAPMTENKKIVWELDTEIVGNYPQSAATVSLFEPEVDCCDLPTHLQPLCGGCPKKCDGNCGAKPEAEVVIEDAAPAVAAAEGNVACCDRPLMLQIVCGCPAAKVQAKPAAAAAASDPFAKLKKAVGDGIDAGKDIAGSDDQP